MGDRIGAYRVLVGKPDERGLLEDTSVDGRIILKCILGSGMGAWTGWMWPKTGIGGELLCMR